MGSGIDHPLVAAGEDWSRIRDSIDLSGFAY